MQVHNLLCSPVSRTSRLSPRWLAVPVLHSSPWHLLLVDVPLYHTHAALQSHFFTHACRCRGGPHVVSISLPSCSVHVLSSHFFGFVSLALSSIADTLVPRCLSVCNTGFGAFDAVGILSLSNSATLSGQCMSSASTPQGFHYGPHLLLCSLFYRSVTSRPHPNTSFSSAKQSSSVPSSDQYLWFAQ